MIFLSATMNRTSRTITTIGLLFAAAIVCNQPCALTGKSQSRVASDSERTISRILTDQGSKDYRGEMAAMLARASIDDLQKMKRHENAGIALQAAWTEWVDDRRQLSGPLHLEAIGQRANRWLGFAEGRLKFSPPKRWGECVLTARPGTVPQIRDPNPARMTSFVFEPGVVNEGFQEVLTGLFGATELTARREGHILILRRTHMKDARIDLRSTGAKILADDQTILYGSTVSRNETASYDIVILQGPRFSKATLIVSSLTIPDRKWVALIGGYHLLGEATEAKKMVMDVIVNEGVLFVFGFSSDLIFCEGFSVTDGKRISRFSSALW